jgi:hypothetical protein
MTAKLLLLLAFASHVPTIDVNRGCRGAESAALPRIGQALIRGAFGTSGRPENSFQ